MRKKIEKILMIVGIISFSGLIQADLVAYYPFEGDASDESGYENHGISNGGVEYVSGVNGNALKLNGVNSEGGTRNPDFIRVPNSPSLQFGSQLTISYWVKIDGDKRQTGANCSGDAVEGISGTVIAKSGDRNGFYISESDVATGMGINPYNGGQGNSTGDLLSVLGEFRFVTYAINDNLINIYVDGELKSSEIGVVDFSRANNEDLYIGVSNNAQGSCLTYWYPLDGVIDELRIYNHTLSESEIQELYNEGSAPNEEGPETPVAILSENLDIHIPVLQYQVNESATANLDVYLSLVPNEEASLTWKLKSYDNIICSRDKNSCSNTPTASTSSSNEANSRTPFDVHIPTILYNSKTYWAHLEYTGNQDKNFIWQLRNYGDFDDNVPPKLSAQPVSSSEALWSQLVLKA